VAARALSEIRFNALAGYTRDPRLVRVAQEFEWLATDDERVIGVLVWDRHDHDFGWIALGRDEREQFRAVEVNSTLATADEARAQLVAAMDRLQAGPPEDLLQGEDGPPPMDFFEPITPEADQHPAFRKLISDPRYSPARELIAAMMRYHQDVDGNFVQQFQTVGFDARLWELYLFAAFTERGFARQGDAVAPDFQFSGLNGSLGVEATTANAPQGEAEAPPLTRETFDDYLTNFIPIKLVRPLRRKLRKQPPYWAAEGMADRPFVLALQDFHAQGSMRFIAPAANELLFGVRHSMREGKIHVERIERHIYGAANEPSGFFAYERAENVSAVLINPQGTLLKFNRMGFLAGFGDPRVRMLREGYRRHEGDPDDPAPRPFRDLVHAPGYAETWVEGMVVIHNPNALIPLDPALIRGATHEFVRPDGRIMSLMPDTPPPYFSSTAVVIEGEEPQPASTGE